MKIYIFYILLALLIILVIFYNCSESDKGIESFNSGKKKVLYYADWCGYCKQFMPEWDKFCNQRLTNITTEKINCAQNQEMCQNSDILGFPTIILYNGNNKSVYHGERTVKGLNNFTKN